MEAGTRAPGEAAPGTPVLGAARRRWGEEAIRLGLFAAAVISVLTTLGIVASLLNETIKFFQDVGVGAFITDGDWKPLFADPQYGIWPLINGTLLVTAIAILVAIPVGLGLGDLPLRVREPANPAGDQAGARGARRRPHGGARLLRAHLRHADDPA